MASNGSNKDIPYLPRSYGSYDRTKRPTETAEDCPDSEKEPLSEDPHHSERRDQSSSSTTDDESAGIVEAQQAQESKTGTAPKEFHPTEESGPPSDPLKDEGSFEPAIDATQMEPEVDEGPLRVRVSVVGVRFSHAGKVYHFATGDLELKTGDKVIVKTEKGLGLGEVAIGPSDKELEPSELDGLRKVLRKAGSMDFEQKARCCQRERQAHDYCLDQIEALGLPMKLVAVECFFDASKYVFYFTADGRVDFRELVKVLVARFPVRIEMRQIGVRHEAKMTGGLACCGQEFCCSRFLVDFRPVSVKMAKCQNLSLNPSKISGVCGRLMCCLGYEYEIYHEFKNGVPKVGRKISTVRGEGVVLKHCPLSETILVKLDEETTIEVGKHEIIGQVNVKSRKKSEGRESGDEN
ncbi:MAG: stage 0 sporulation family protein [Deltaproteobacteria bacterium]